MKKILLVNQGHTDNLGDKVICEVMSRILKEKYEVDVMPYISTEEEKDIKQKEKEALNSDNKSKNNNLKRYIYKIVPDYYFYNFKYQKEIKKRLANKKYDLVIIGGGELISSFHPFVSAFKSWVSIVKRYLDCPIAVFGVSGDFPKDIYAQRVYAKYIAKCNYVNVRDKNTISILKDKYNIEANYSPDCGFLYKNMRGEEGLTAKEHIVVAMIHSYEEIKNVISYNNKYEYFDYWYEMIVDKLKHNSKVVLAYTTYVDKISCIEFKEYIESNKEVDNIDLINTDSLNSLVELFSKSNTVITGRMHAMILSLTYNNVVFPYIFKEKIRVFNEEWINSTFNINQVEATIKNEFNNLDRLL